MDITPDKLSGLADQIRRWGNELGFQQVGFGSIELDEDERHLKRWLAAGKHGTMDYMNKHGRKRSPPEELVPGTVRGISVRMDYLPESQENATQLLDHESTAYVSPYALGRDSEQRISGRTRNVAREINHRGRLFGYE